MSILEQRKNKIAQNKQEYQRIQNVVSAEQDSCNTGAMGMAMCDHTMTQCYSSLPQDFNNSASSSSLQASQSAANPFALMFQRPKLLLAASIILVSISTTYTWGSIKDSNQSTQLTSAYELNWHEASEPLNLLSEVHPQSLQTWRDDQEKHQNQEPLLTIPERFYTPNKTVINWLN